MKLFLIISTVFFTTAYSQNFVFHNFTGNFSQLNVIKFSIYLNTYNGFFIFIYDILGHKVNVKFDDSLSIVKVASEYVVKIFNNKNLCGCSNCQNDFLNMVVKFRKSTFSVKCNSNNEETFQEIVKGKTKKVKEFDPQNQNLPLRKSTQIFIKFGKTNPKSDTKVRIRGCLKGFSLNNVTVDFRSKGLHFLKNCTKIFKEKLCIRKLCSERNSSLPVYYCSNAFYTDKRLKQSQIRKTEIPKVFIVQDSKDSNFRIKFHTTSVKTHSICLVEFAFSNAKTVLVYVNTKQEILIHREKANAVMEDNNIFKEQITDERLFSVYVILNKTVLTIMACRSNRTFQYIEKFDAALQVIYLGGTKKDAICHMFSDSSELRFNSDGYREYNGFSKIMKIVIIALSILVLCALIAGAAVYHYLRQKHQNDNAIAEPEESVQLKDTKI